MREKERQINRGKEKEVDGWRQGRKKREEPAQGKTSPPSGLEPGVPYLEVKEQEIRMTSDVSKGQRLLEKERKHLPQLYLHMMSLTPRD